MRTGVPGKLSVEWGREDPAEWAVARRGDDCRDPSSGPGAGCGDRARSRGTGWGKGRRLEAPPSPAFPGRPIRGAFAPF